MKKRGRKNKVDEHTKWAHRIFLGFIIPLLIGLILFAFGVLFFEIGSIYPFSEMYIELIFLIIGAILATIGISNFIRGKYWRFWFS
jgi:hypothetical protein